MIIRPLINLTKKGIPFYWGKGQDDAFVKLKETFLSALVIKMPDTTKPFFVMTGASLTASGGILMQKDSNGVMVEEPPASFSPFSPADCTMFSHFSFNDFIAIAFLDLTGDLDIQI